MIKGQNLEVVKNDQTLRNKIFEKFTEDPVLGTRYTKCEKLVFFGFNIGTKNEKLIFFLRIFKIHL